MLSWNAHRQPRGRWLRVLPVAVFAALCVLFFFALDNDPQKLPSALVGRPLPEFELPGLPDPEKTYRAADVIGKPFLLNVWATWCPSCRVEHATLVRLSKAGVPILGLNYKDVSADALAYLKRYQNPFEWSISDEVGSLGFELGVYGAPETFFVDATGTIVHRYVGAITDEVWRRELSARYEAMGGAPGILAASNAQQANAHEGTAQEVAE